jgi:hypothetical protein
MNNTTARGSAKNPIEVVITVTQFKDVLATSDRKRDTDFQMKMGKEDPRAYVDGANLFIKPPGAPVRFSVDSAPGDSENYYPVGITFVREREHNTSDKQRLGLLNFPQNESRGDIRSFLITDSYQDGAKSVRYKFSVILQRGSDGIIGIIDPGIEHDPSECAP